MITTSHTKVSQCRMRSGPGRGSLLTSDVWSLRAASGHFASFDGSFQGFPFLKGAQSTYDHAFASMIAGFASRQLDSEPPAT